MSKSLLLKGRGREVLYWGRLLPSPQILDHPEKKLPWTNKITGIFFAIIFLFSDMSFVLRIGARSYFSVNMKEKISNMGT
jgi:hypothetical protein